MRVLQSRQGQLIASPEEIAYRQGWIDRWNFEGEEKLGIKNN